MKVEKKDFLIQLKYADLVTDAENVGRYFLGFGGELYLTDSELTGYDTRIIMNIKSFVKNNRLPLRLHAPISEIDYSQIDTLLSFMQPLYQKVIRLCKILDINNVVTHVEFNYKTDFPIDKQLENAVSLWSSLTDDFRMHGIYLNIENHYEAKPHHLIALMEIINSPYLGMCIDVGHSNAFSNLGVKNWIEKYPLSSIKEVHLADNKGDGDTHLPLGEGNIDFASFFEIFERRGEASIFVLEPRNIGEAQQSLLFLEKLRIL